MAERKVVNKYYPADFDPAKLPRKRAHNKIQQTNVRTMLSMSIRCNTCGSFIYRGTKINSRKEQVSGETYYGVAVYRFYFKCTGCSSEIVMKTDPRNDDYVIESGATRNFEPWRVEETDGSMDSLEKRIVDANRERKIVQTLEELKCMKSRRVNVSVDAMLGALRRSEEERLEEEDEAVLKSIFRGSKEVVRRINDEDLDDAVTKKRKVSGEVYDMPTNYLTKTTGVDRLSKRGELGGRIVLKSSTVKFCVVKKSS